MFFTNKMSDEEAKRKALEEMRWLYDEPTKPKDKPNDRQTINSKGIDKPIR
jgi:hypothetical protein